MKPIAIGAAMGAMMFWMLHGQSTSTNTLAGWALVAFIGVHLAMIAAAGFAIIFAARLSPKTREMLAWLHRPSWHHLALMVIGMVASVGTIHVVVHGGIA